MLEKGQTWRLLSGPLEHSSHFHFMFCLLSLAVKGFVLERPMTNASSRSLFFLGRFVAAFLLVPLAYALAGWAVYSYSGDYGVYTECVQGMTGVLFAIKVLSLWTNSAVL